MTDIPANPNINPRRYSRFWFRFLEIFPGAIVWLCLIAPFILSLYLPLEVTIFIVLFDVYWLMRSLSYGFILARGYGKFKNSLATNWEARFQELLSLSPEEQIEAGVALIKPLYHAVIITMYKEEAALIRPGLDSILNSAAAKDNIIIILATEGRAGTEGKKQADILKAEYAGKFKHFLITVHPDNILGEVKAKGANASWAGRQLVVFARKHEIGLNQVLVSTADADSRFHPQYFACLGYTFLTTPNNVQAAFQPVAMYFNNIWEAPMLSRVMAFGTTFWQLIESVRDYRLISFATHATSLQTLQETDFWCTSIVNEDSRQFFRGYFHYAGKFRIIPLFIPIYMDAVHTRERLSTLKNLYLQQQRWAYGVEHFPYIVLESLRRSDIPWGSRALLVFRAFSGAYSWATSAFFLTVVGWLPLLLNPAFQSHVAASNFPLVTKLLLSLTWIGLLISGFITWRLLNTVFHGKRPIDFTTMFLQWLLVPIASLLFGALPGIDSQTRLMLGKYLGFRVTEKVIV
jgi:hypothetical protein